VHHTFVTQPGEGTCISFRCCNSRYCDSCPCRCGIKSGQ